MQAQPAPSKLPVVVLTSSNQEQDMKQARAMGADEYRVKPNEFDQLVQIVNEVRTRWLNGEEAATAELTVSAEISTA
jgi:DNA-binding response OmpR family regulator